ncbi:MAG: hypothetical protein Q9162_001787 [Coniocarpon cinnabarinum]
MGTRGLLGHILRNGRKKGAYNHWDSYPEGLGDWIVKFIKSLSEEQIQQMAERVEQIEWVSEDERVPSELQIKYSEFANLGVASRSSADWYCLLYNMQGAGALPRILDGSLGHLIDEDTLFCEWAYWVDWNKREFTVNEHTCDFKEVSLKWMQKTFRRDEEEESDGGGEEGSAGESDGEPEGSDEKEESQEEKRKSTDGEVK